MVPHVPTAIDSTQAPRCKFKDTEKRSNSLGFRDVLTLSIELNIVMLTVDFVSRFLRRFSDGDGTGTENDISKYYFMFF